MTAAEWGMTWVRPPIAEKLLDGETFIHHVGGGAWMDQDAITTFRGLNTWAQTGKGYSALDYDVLVHYHRATDVLTIAEGRGKWMSAATKDRNEQGEAVCVCGNYTLREPLPIEIEGAALGVVYGIEHGWISPATAILGHKDNPAHVGATGCPGDHMYAQLPTIRQRVAAILNPPPPPGAKPTPPKEGSVFAGFWQLTGQPQVYAAYEGGYKAHLFDPAALAWAQALARLGGHDDKINVTPDVGLIRALGTVVDWQHSGPPEGLDRYGVPVGQ
jgi:hypothetical protein